MSWFLILLAWLVAIVLLIPALYRAVLLVASLLGDRSVPDPAPATPRPHFAVVIPAHDEELLIRALLASIRGADHPQQQITIHVVADNCSDATAERVRACGEIVLERTEPDNPGKGQALRWALGEIDLQAFDAIAFLDADTLVDAGFFRAMERELASGGRCLQAAVDLSNPDDNVMTRLLAITYVMKNRFFHGGKRVLGLSVLLMGAGMVFRREVIEEVGWVAMGIGEDLEQSFALLRAGEKIRFVPDARTAAQESSGLAQGTTQRQRWASGRRELNPVARRAIVDGTRSRSLDLVDAGFDLLLPSYAKHANASLLGLALAFALRGVAPGALWVIAGVCVYQALEITLGLAFSGGGVRQIAALAFAPVFLVWRGAIDLWTMLGNRPGGWVRTGRGKPRDSEPD